MLPSALLTTAVFNLLLQVNTSVTSVGLGYNNIGDEGGKAMAEMLKVRLS
jgi:hypothetical protein